MSVEETKHRDVSEHEFPEPPEGHHWNIIPRTTSGGDINIVVELVKEGVGWGTLVGSKVTPRFTPGDLEAAKAAVARAMHSILAIIDSPVWGLEGEFK